MFIFTETISISSRTEQIWKTLVEIEQWWPPSNPEHIGIDVLNTGKPIEVGTKINFEERVAGIKARATGAITQWVPEKVATWEGEALYTYFGIPIRIHEGVSWTIENKGNVSALSATVWAKFPPNRLGRFLEWYMNRFMNVIEKDKVHARCELEYLKRMIEEQN